MSEPKNEVVTEIEGGLLLQLDGSITDRDGNKVSAKEAKEAAESVENTAPPAVPVNIVADSTKGRK